MLQVKAGVKDYENNVKMNDTCKFTVVLFACLLTWPFGVWNLQPVFIWKLNLKLQISLKVSQ